MATISSVYANAGTWAASDIITGVTMRNSLNNIHVIDTNSVVAVNTTNTQVYTDNGSGTYVSQQTYSDSADVVGYDKQFTLNNNLYIYNTTEPSSETRWTAGSNTKYSVNLGSLGSFTNNTFSNQIDTIDALNEIRAAILALNISGVSVSLPKYVSDINPDSSSINFAGYEIIVNTGTSTNEATSFSINDAGADGTNITANYEFETDGTGTANATTITLTEPDGTGTLTLTVAADNTSDDQSNQIGTDLIALINNNVESPNDYSATYDNSTKNVIGVRVYDSASRFIYENIGIIKCGDTCTEDGKPRFEFVANRFPTPTPSNTVIPTPTMTPTPTYTPTHTPTPSPSSTDCGLSGHDNFNSSGSSSHINWGLLRVVSQYLK